MPVTMLFSVSIVILQTVILLSQEAQFGRAMFLFQRRDRQRLSQNRSLVQILPWGYYFRTVDIQRYGRNTHQRQFVFFQRTEDEVFHQGNVGSFERNQPIEEDLITPSPQRQMEDGEIFFRDDGTASRNEDKTENGDNQGYWSRAQTGFADLLCVLCRRERRIDCVNIYCNN